MGTERRKHTRQCQNCWKRSKDNMNTAYKRVCANKGAGGVDGVSVEELGDHIKENWESIRNQIRSRKYKPQPVRRVEIPKPNGGMRKLGIPTVMDRVIQQGIVQVISPICEPLFSEWSYGFRPSKSCEMAIRQLLVYLNVIRQIKRCLFRQIKTGLSEHLTME